MLISTNPTRRKILHEGLALMSSSGLNAVTLGVLAERVGMSKSGLFAHFRSKEAVQIALLHHTAEVAEEWILKPSADAPPGLSRLQMLVRRWFGWTRSAGLPGGCPIAAGFFEFDDAEGVVRDKLLEMETGWRAYLRQLIGEAVDEKQFRKNLDVDQFVWELCGIYLSYHAARRFLRSDDADMRAEKALQNLLERASTNAGRQMVGERAFSLAGEAATVRSNVRKT